MAEEAFDWTSWLAKLQDELADFDAAYSADKGSASDKQEAALGALVVVTNNLQQLPSLSPHLRPLEALVHALDALYKGSSHPLILNHASTIGGRRLTSAQEFMQAQSVAMLRLLTDAGLQLKEALPFLANLLARAGVQGTRGRRPITASSLKSWQENVVSGDHPDRTMVTDQIYEERRTLFLKLENRWPPTADEAKAIVSAIINSEQFRAQAASAAKSC